MQVPEEIITLYFIWNFQWFECAICYLGNCSHPEEMAYVRCTVVWKCDAFKLSFMCHNTVSSSLSEVMSPYLTTVLHSRQGIRELVLPFISRNPLHTYHPQRDHHWLQGFSPPCYSQGPCSHLTSFPSTEDQSPVLPFHILPSFTPFCYILEGHVQCQFLFCARGTVAMFSAFKKPSLVKQLTHENLRSC